MRSRKLGFLRIGTAFVWPLKWQHSWKYSSLWRANYISGTVRDLLEDWNIFFLLNPYSKFANVNPKQKLREVKCFTQVAYVEGSQAWTAIHKCIEQNLCKEWMCVTLEAAMDGGGTKAYLTHGVKQVFSRPVTQVFSRPGGQSSPARPELGQEALARAWEWEPP